MEVKKVMKKFLLIALFMVLSAINAYADDVDTTISAITETTTTYAAVSVGTQQRLLYKNLLSDNQKKVYDQFVEYISDYQHSDWLVPAAAIDRSDIAKIMTAVWADHPEYIMYEPNCWYYYKRSGMVTSLQLTHVYNPQMYSWDEQKFQYDYFNEQLDIIATVIKEIPTFEGKLSAINNYICDSTFYAKGFADQSALSVINYHASVCAGYSRATQLLCEKVGIPCYYIVGYAGQQINTRSVQHAWNVVIDESGLPWAIDVTWNDDETSFSTKIVQANRQKYFMIPDIYNIPEHQMCDLSKQLMNLV